eukprot:CAMPEP_0202726312 /NCGR_PEP_ID=MMETSP1385-20130828/184548_1 /ASSEMBLY_ACC=CAM_ASM_000861 /TAXON_ID=933848 /ORGANISM="Elphidium margaritaceum" /LENGTH=1178 /DNA_ID=CAMNT_0049392531 /DNA_START=45 /DNA_END=3579 /DNA_ORIENTATION=+
MSDLIAAGQNLSDQNATGQNTSDQNAAGQNMGDQIAAGLKQQYILFEWEDKTISMKVKSVSAAPFDAETHGVFLPPIQSRLQRTKTVEEVRIEEVETLFPDSTNGWLYTNFNETKSMDGGDSASQTTSTDGDGGGSKPCYCSENLTNILSAVIVIAVQITVYATMATYLVRKTTNEAEERAESCYGPNCDAEIKYCMFFGTSGLTSVLLVGFLWADVVNTLSIMWRHRCDGWRHLFASFLVLAELATAIVCGFEVARYSETDFDAIGGAVGILFVHDLDEKVFASMKVFNGKRSASSFKSLALALWLCASFFVAYGLSCLLLTNEAEERAESCYGPNCDAEIKYCMFFGTSGLTSVLLVGFLWADVVNTLSIMWRHRCDGWRHLFASFLVLAELATAIVCGFEVARYSETDFDAIGGAVGILFVHDLDEKVFASMKVFNGKRSASSFKSLALALWLCASFFVALGLSCQYVDEATGDVGLWNGGQCTTEEFLCANGECIWEGLVCNGVTDCNDASDEGVGELVSCTYSAETMNCPEKNFLCVEDGACIDEDKRCDGILDCPGGSDEGREQNCTDVIALKKCSDTQFSITDKYPNLNDTYHKVWSGRFKCANGQCIDAHYACDGVLGDCVDGSDEYPLFDKSLSYPFIRSCPYPALIECDAEDLLCKVDGKCIEKDALCNGINDCVDGSDEDGCEYDCQSLIMQDKRYQCGGRVAKKVNGSFLALHNYESTVEDGFTLVAYSPITVSQYFQGETGLCIPIAWRCDGINDCPDGDDERACKLFACDDSHYTCPDSGKCIAKTWLCDGIYDCEDKSDESPEVCTANGVDISTNVCGDNYQCIGSEICVPPHWMCDDWQDCPQNDDEEPAVCAGFNNTKGLTLTCGETATGDAYLGTHISFNFTLPTEYEAVKISTCVTANQGPSWIYMFSSDLLEGTIYANESEECQCEVGRYLLVADTAASLDAISAPYPIINQGPSWIYMLSSDQSVWIYVGEAEECQCEVGRYLLVADTAASLDAISAPYPIIKGQEYTVDLEPYFTGGYALKVDCGASAGAIETHNVCTNDGDYDTLYKLAASPYLICGSTSTGTISAGESYAGDFYLFEYNVSVTGNLVLNGCASQANIIFDVFVFEDNIETWDQWTWIAGNDDDETGTCQDNLAPYLPVVLDSMYDNWLYLLVIW